MSLIMPLVLTEYTFLMNNFKGMHAFSKTHELYALFALCYPKKILGRHTAFTLSLVWTQYCTCMACHIHHYETLKGLRIVKITI